ncbi:MAG TPA: type IV secretion system DNA-binding domain-containing protein [Vicinamibacteria bacterium]|nr:type IV secretion system DNA-binding domain-containing protein [Vicinamibacteria bacterium]
MGASLPRLVLVFLAAALLAPVFLLASVWVWWIAHHGPLVVVLTLILFFPILRALLVLSVGRARLLGSFRVFGLLLGSRGRRWMTRALLLAAILAGLGPPLAQQEPGRRASSRSALAPGEWEAQAAHASPFLATVLLGFVGLGGAGLAGVLLARWGRLRRRSFGDAHFERIDREFGRRRDAVAALLVRRRENRAARRRLVPFSTPASTRLAFLTWDQLSRHLLVVGASGAGKTTGFFNHLMLSATVPWVYQDQKAELPLRERFPTRPVWGLDTRGRRTRSAVWNPLDEIQSPEDVDVLAALLFPDRPGDQNLWVARGARRIFGSLLKLEHHDSLQSLAWSLENEPADALAGRLPAGSAATLADPRTRGHYLSELLEVLSPWTSSRIARVTQARSTVSLEAFMTRGGYVLANEAEQELRGPVTAFWGLLFHRLRNRPAGAAPLVLLLDEFGDAGRIPHMAQALALYRAKNVSLVAGIQSYALMESVYGREWKAVRDGFATTFVLTANLDPGLAGRLSRELGRFTRSRVAGNLTAHLSSHGPSLGPSLGYGQEIGVDLVSRDEWGRWSDARACLVRAARPTWWVPCPIEIGATPLGAPEEVPAADGRAVDARRRAAVPPKSPPDRTPPSVQRGNGGGPGPDGGSSREPWSVF